MNQQGTAEMTETSQQDAALRDWEESEWFQEWIARHESGAAAEQD